MLLVRRLAHRAVYVSERATPSTERISLVGGERPHDQRHNSATVRDKWALCVWKWAAQAGMNALVLPACERNAARIPRALCRHLLSLEIFHGLEPTEAIVGETAGLHRLAIPHVPLTKRAEDDMLRACPRLT